MNIAIDISPLKSGNYLQHRVRGTGFYLENLKRSLLKYYPDNSYTFFTRGERLPKSAKWRIDLIHYPYFEPFFLTLPLFQKNKTVVTVHDLTPLVFPKEFPAGLKGRIKWKIQKQALQNADSIIADSISSKDDIVKYTGINPSKISVVYLAASNGFKKIDKTSILGSIRKKYNLPEKFVLYVGDVTWNKNLPRFITAIQKINVPLVMVGKALTNTDVDLSNPWNKDLTTVKKLIKGDKQILCLGFISQEELVLLYNIATVFVMPSLYEGFGLPILEAMSCGCPVVTSKEGSIPEITGNAVINVDAYDVDSIAHGINEIFNSSDLQKKLSEKGIIQSKKFSWQITAKKTIELYEKALLTIE